MVVVVVGFLKFLNICFSYFSGGSLRQIINNTTSDPRPVIRTVYLRTNEATFFGDLSVVRHIVRYMNCLTSEQVHIRCFLIGAHLIPFFGNGLKTDFKNSSCPTCVMSNLPLCLPSAF